MLGRETPNSEPRREYNYMLAKLSKTSTRAHRPTHGPRWVPKKRDDIFRSYRSVDGRYHRLDRLDERGHVVRIHLIDLRKRDRRGYAAWRCLQLAERDDRAEFYRLLEETVG